MGSATSYFSRSSIVPDKEVSLTDKINICRSESMLCSFAHYLWLFLPVDGQSIAIRLAKQISTTTENPKRAISRFNSHPTNEYEGAIYHLPRSLQWKKVTDTEGLVAVELSTLPDVTIDTDLVNKAIRAYHMKQRAEEIVMVKEDMERAAEFYTA